MPWLDAEYKREKGEDPEKQWPIYEPLIMRCSVT